MRRARVLFLLLLLLVAGAYLGLYGLQSGWFSTSSSLSDRMAEPADPPLAGGSRASAVRPSFDIVRAEPDGTTIMAGRAEPGWAVVVESGGRPIGQTQADENGEWVMDRTERLSKGEHSLELKAESPDGGRTLFSKQRLALSLSDPRQDQPMVALTEEGKSTRVLQMPPPAAEDRPLLASPPPAPQQAQSAAVGATPIPSAPAGITQAPPAAPAQPPAPPSRIGFAAVDYEEAGDKSVLHLSGQAAPGSRVMLYIDNVFEGTTRADATGSWAYSGNKVLPSGQHAMRADLLENDTAKVVARAEVKFDRRPDIVAIADDEDKLAPPVAALASGQPAEANAEQQAAAASADGEQPASSGKGQVIVVRSGDTLWQIAERYYGSGAKYTQIFRSNRKQIRDPNWIYPSQRFELPE